MIIRKEQMEMMQAISMGRFVRTVGDHLQVTYPAMYNTLAPEDIEMLVAEVIETGKEYDMESERELIKFIDLIMLAGKRFYKKNEWESVLKDDRLFPEQRLDQLLVMIKETIHPEK
jgi:hypothetical protein